MNDYLYMNKLDTLKNITLIAGLLMTGFGNSVMAQDLKTALTQVHFDQQGFYTSIKVDGKELLEAGKYPIVSVYKDKKIIQPKALKVNGDRFSLTMEDGQAVELKVGQQKEAITYEVLKLSPAYKLLVFGPVKIKLHEVVGEVVGVAQGEDLAFGMQALHVKTVAGIPEDYVEAYSTKFGYQGQNSNLSVASISFGHFAAVDAGNGAVFQLSAKNRSTKEVQSVKGLNHMVTLPVEGADGLIIGAKVALFGDKKSQILSRIGKVEVEQGLPHPMIAGEWAKVSRNAMGSYLITNFSAANLDFALEKTKRAGFKNLYHPDPFLNWGHFEWRKELSTESDAGMKKLVDRAAQQGINIGIHTLSNFTTTNDPYVTPVPSKHLLKQGELKLTTALDDSQQQIIVENTELFSLPLTLNTLQIEDELITYGKAEKSGEQWVLTNCVRGAFGTHKASHGVEKVVYKLWDYPYKTLFPDLTLQDEYAKRLTDIFNKTGVKQISFDGLEGCMYTGQDYYATGKFVSDFYQGLTNKTDLINDASRLDHYLWHIHTRMNWGEPWGEEMRAGQVENRIKNQAYFQRNLFPRMLGWFLVRLADRKFEATSLEDLEWALSESAGFDSGYAMSIDMKTFQQHGQIDLLLESMKNWDQLRLADVFTAEQKLRLKDPKTEWHLEKIDDTKFMLYPLFVSKRYHCDLSSMQPGQPGGADWSWESPEESSFALRIKVEGDGTIENPSFKTDKGIVKIFGKLEKDQYILLDHKGKATLTDKNYGFIADLTVQGTAILPKGGSAVAFSCDTNSEEKPEVIVRYNTRMTGEPLNLIKK
ncbi:hypothetical protein [Sphingobacterium sp.]|uniref:hypothetical protein n=1 Tax=Sphingobacterium sp. TaxID=341027 RepID=UPI002590E8C7|nr:hypothetical protein [Sphingobacterium sp.]WET67276.1 MAG: hypothetical protein P0Y57_15670 [Sphingobacterium sp.]